MIRRILEAAAALLAMAVISGSAWAIPAKLTIHGTLLDENGERLIYPEEYIEGTTLTQTVLILLDARLSFYPDEQAPIPSQEIVTQAHDSLGRFWITFEPPEEMLVLDEYFYELEIDADRDGLDENDRFEGRFRIGAVPYALSTKPVPYYMLHGGWTRTYGGDWNMNKTKVFVAPFTTPPGGVRFSRMIMPVPSAEDGTVFSFGLYDDQGERVASSGPIRIEGADFAGLVEITLPRITLQPSRLHLSALHICVDRSQSTSFLVAGGGRPPSPLLGHVPAQAGIEEIPPQIAFEEIVYDEEFYPCPISLVYDQSDDLKKGAPPRIRFIRSGDRAVAK